MPLPLVPMIAAGASLLGQAGSLFGQSRANKDARGFAWHMYDRQRADALADWNMQNEYNSPNAQMKRYKEAGLNPNLIYGQAGYTAPAVRSSQGGSYKPEPLNFGGAVQNVLNQYYDTRLREQQLDNLKAQHDVLVQDRELKAANVQNTYMKTDTGSYDLSFKQGMSELYRQKLSNEVIKTGNEGDLIAQKTANEWLKGQYINKTIEEQLKFIAAQITRSQAETERINATIDNLKRTGQLQDLELNLRKLGVNPNDPIYLRVLGQFLNKFGLSPY